MPDIADDVVERMAETRKHGNWPNCPCCDGSGYDYGTCAVCGGSGRDPECCEQCEESAVGFNDDGEHLCEDCLFEWATEQQP